MPMNNPPTNGEASGGGDAPARTSSPHPSPRRKKMLSFEPNTDFFVIDESTIATPGGAPPGAAAVARARQLSHEGRRRQNSGGPTAGAAQPELMGPVLRRKKVVSVPLGGAYSNDFFYGDRRGQQVHTMVIDETSSNVDEGGSLLGALPEGQQQNRRDRRLKQYTAPTSGRGQGFFDQVSAPTSPGTTGGKPRRKKTNSFMAGLLTRRAVALDLLPSEEADLGVYEFFHAHEPKVVTENLLPSGLADKGEETKEEELEESDEEAFNEEGGEAAAVVSEEEVALQKPKVKLFKPLVFPPRVIPKGGGGDGGGHEHGAASPRAPAKEVDTVKKPAVAGTAEEAVPLTTNTTKEPTSPETTESEEEEESSVDLIEKYDDSHIIKATRKDYFFTGVLFCVMAALVGVVVGWDTHLDESDSIFGPVGLACKTPCRGDVWDQDYFHGQNTFKTGDVIFLSPHIDATLTENSFLRLIIRGVQTNQTKWVSPDDMFGPASVEGERVTKEERVTVDWDNPEEQHVIDVLSTTGSQQVPPPYYEDTDEHDAVSAEEDRSDNATEAKAQVGSEEESSHSDNTAGEVSDGKEATRRKLSSGGSGSTSDNPYADLDHHGELTYTLYASRLHPISDQSILVAALIMVFVYIFILLEVIHRTLVAIFGSMIALFFFFLMHDGHTESIATIMLHMEWSTLGLLFGMMLLVGEMSHTGVFEWCSVRLLVASKGSFNRLCVLLCALVAISSAFLDNVTTMLLIAPVTIDMCGILGVDPRPYLIGEVILSNVGGTATLIGDPPNIIIGSSFDEIGFVDFIINILPCIFIFCIPVSLFLVLKIYKYYFTSETMVTLNVRQLKKTYQIYDEPRLLIAGTSTFFVILMFFLHPVHHKDTAWIALLGAFITIAFTNPHDVQDALRNHVEWDTLLFFAGLFVLVEVCAAMGLLRAIGDVLASFIKSQDEDKQLAVAITLILWVSAITSAFLDNIPYTATMIPIIRILANELPDTLPIEILAWALSFGACLGGNGTLLGASANIVTAGLSTSRGYNITFLNFFYPGFLTMIVTVAIANIYMLVVYVWI